MASFPPSNSDPISAKQFAIAQQQLEAAQDKIIVRDKTAAHAMKRLNNEALLLCPLSIAVLMLGAM
ncbi:hypothetical protein BC629DRAFT_1589179 [Irpex lacteus]|nr:hypothetical protein BC629DRAFT_1589179 [Irpex lacteus]